MQQYYTLEEAARALQTTPDKVRDMANRKELRAFQDRGTLRFRAQEIDKLARERGLQGSDPALQMGDAARPAPADDRVPLGEEKLRAGSSKGSKGPRSPGPRSPAPRPAGDSDVRLVLEGSNLDFQIEVEDSGVKVSPAAPAPGAGRKSRVAPPEHKAESDVKVPPATGSRLGRKSRIGPPDQPTGGDSGVRIVPLDQPSDSDVKMVPDRPTESKVGLGSGRSKRPSDSDIRLEDIPLVGPGKDRKSDPAHVTEEIDLDAEAMKAAQEAAKAPKTKHRPASRLAPREPPAPNLPTGSPFELSEFDVGLEGGAPPPGKPKGKAETDSSSEFDLSLDADSSPFELGSDELPPLKLDEEEVSLGELSGPGAGQSGINLTPGDSGISLEEGGSDEIDLDLGLEAVARASGNTPRPGPAAPAGVEGDSSSEFELTLDDDKPAADADSDSEFELTLDDEGKGAGAAAVGEADSDSEFELTLDDDKPAAEGGADSSSEFELTLGDDKPAADSDSESDSEFELSLDEAPGDPGDSSSEFELTLDAGDDAGDLALEPADQATDGSDSEFELTLDAEGELAPAGDAEGQDIFEDTSFDVPALDEESASEAVVLDEGDTDLETGDELELSLDDLGTEADSDSQVVPLEEGEEADAAAETVARPRKGTKVRTRVGAAAPRSEEAELDLDLDLDVDAGPSERVEEEPVAAGAAAPAAPAHWGPIPAILLFPTVVVLFLVALMGFELIQGMFGYSRPNKLSKPVLEQVAKIFVDEKQLKEVE